ncbi:ESX secretion-associated protein EspG [Rhodococcus spongiicola]|uniref:ESX secretion-associated protein EspG n=1 Tax=Rhodococcus spongiicola TaxID=2487352 RepID=A0A3S3AJR7_9NOCA|nr:ESX secretion-associated protein EspG [Rhodococcus spongiicola]RVW02255.1 ESX secretion-associated protein EspG [Rhodococcus spongiicola]
MIDLGLGPIGATLPPTTLHVDEIDLLAHLLGIDVLPVVLDTGPRFDELSGRDAAFRDAYGTLDSAGLIEGIDEAPKVHPDLAGRLRTLARPRAEIAVRRYGGGTIHRACLARDEERADAGVLALRSGDTFTIQRVEGTLAEPLRHALGSVEPVHFDAVNCPTADLAAALDQITAPQGAAHLLTAVGVRAEEAAVLGPAFADCPAFAEIVGLVHVEGGSPVMHGPVTVFDTSAGRIVGTTSVATDGIKWTSLGPGTPGRLQQAIEALLAQIG